MAATDATQLKRRLSELTGLDTTLLDQAALHAFVRRRCRSLGIPTASAYYAAAVQDPDERELLVHEVSVTETWFFRYPPSFEVLKSHAAALLRQRRTQLRMLCIACATGEEAYGIAMAAAEAGWPLEKIVVDAFDRHAPSLQIARDACYGENSLRGGIPAWAKKWFRPAAGGVRVDPRLVATANFVRRDVVGNALPEANNSYDVVSCRNLFIYLSAEARKKLVNGLASAISDDGLLLVGHAEVGIVPSAEFEPAGVPHAFALRRRPAEPVAPKVQPVSPRPLSAPDKQAVAAVETDQTPIPARPAADARVATTLKEARAMADAGQLGQATAALDAMAARIPPSPDVFSLLGSIHLSQGQLDKAQDAFSKVLYIDPNHETALLQLAIVCDRLGHGDRAARFRRRAARAHESSTPETTTEAP